MKSLEELKKARDSRQAEYEKTTKTCDDLARLRGSTLNDFEKRVESYNEYVRWIKDFQYFHTYYKSWTPELHAIFSYHCHASHEERYNLMQKEKELNLLEQKYFEADAARTHAQKDYEQADSLVKQVELAAEAQAQFDRKISLKSLRIEELKEQISSDKKDLTGLDKAIANYKEYDEKILQRNNLMKKFSLNDMEHVRVSFKTIDYSIESCKKGIQDIEDKITALKAYQKTFLGYISSFFNDDDKNMENLMTNHQKLSETLALEQDKQKALLTIDGLQGRIMELGKDRSYGVSIASLEREKEDTQQTIDKNQRELPRLEQELATLTASQNTGNLPPVEGAALIDTPQSVPGLNNNFSSP